MKTAKTVLYTDKQREAQLKTATERIITVANQFKSEFDQIDKGFIKTKEDLLNALSSPQGFYNSKMLERVPAMQFGIQLTYEARQKMIPAIDLSKAEAWTHTIGGISRGHNADYTRGINLQNGKVVFDEADFSAYIIENCTVTAYENEKNKIEIMRLHQEFADTFKRFRDLTFSHCGQNNTHEYFSDIEKLLKVSGNDVQIETDLYSRWLN